MRHLKKQNFSTLKCIGGEEWRDGQTAGEEAKVDVHSIHSFDLQYKLVSFYIWSWKHTFSDRENDHRCARDNSCFLCNLCTATSNTHAHRVGEKERQIDTAALQDFRGQGSGSWCACFRSACTAFRHAAPASLSDPEVQFCSFNFSMSLSLKHRDETQEPGCICFMCSRFKPPTRQQQQQATGGYIHICYSDLGCYHLIVWHTICIKIKLFSVLVGLAWLKTIFMMSQKEVLQPLKACGPGIIS